MALESIPRCDQCKRVKEESNNWLMATVRVFGMGMKINLQEFDPKRAKGKLTFCGTPCFLQKVSVQIPISSRNASEGKP